MELDYITIRLIYNEILPLVKASQIREIVASGERGIVFVLRDGHEKGILFSAEPQNSRFHLVQTIPQRSKNPDSHFHRMVRHHLGGAIVEDFVLVEGERIIEINTARKDFSGEIKRYSFIAELMGRHSNLILTDENRMILAIDHPRRVSDKSIRELKTGKRYQAPPVIQRIPLKAYLINDFARFMSESDPEITWGKLILDNFIGATPGIVRYISERSQVSDRIPVREISKDLIEKIHDAFLSAIERIRDARLFPPFDNLLEFDPLKEYPINQAVEEFYSSLTAKEFSEKRESIWKKTVEAKIKSLEKLHANITRDSQKSREADNFKLMGDLIFAFPDKFDGDVREAEMENIFDPQSDEKIKVRLLPGKNAIESAQEYHKRAKRMRRGEKEISGRLKETSDQLVKFRELLNTPHEILTASDEKFQKALDDLKGGRTDKIIKKKKGVEVSTELPKSLRGENIHHYRSVEGHDIYVGGNDRANEVLLKWGQDDDYWLHVKNIPGSHVLIPRRGTAIEFDTILFAAQIAVFHSQAKGSNKVPVDYTFLKYVNKPTGAAAGFVTYKKEKNVRVDSPDERKIDKYKVK